MDNERWEKVCCKASGKSSLMFKNRYGGIWLAQSVQHGILYFFLILLLHLFIFERQSTSRGGAAREWDTESQAGSGLWAVSTEPGWGGGTHKPWVRSWPEPKSDAQPTEPPRRPQNNFYSKWRGEHFQNKIAVQENVGFSVNISLLFSVYLFILRERESREGAERREGEKEFQAGSVAVSTEPNSWLELTTREIMTWAKIKSQMLTWLCHPGGSCQYRS